MRTFAVAAASALAVVLTPAVASAAPVPIPAAQQPDRLGRGVINVHNADGNRVSWRLLADDPPGVTFTVYRDGVRLAEVSGPTSYYDKGAPSSARYTVRAVVNGVERAAAGNS